MSTKMSSLRYYYIKRCLKPIQLKKFSAALLFMSEKNKINKNLNYIYNMFTKIKAFHL